MWGGDRLMGRQRCRLEHAPRFVECSSNRGRARDYAPAMSTHWADGTSAITAVASTLAAIASWRAAQRSNRTAEAVARIERNRWQTEMEPTFDITIVRSQGDHATLDVQLTGPHALRQLDEIIIDILASDDQLRDPLNPHGRPTAEDVANHTWGPYRFTPRTDGADEHGKRVAPFALQVGRGRPFAIELTRPPLWQEGDDRNRRWREQWDGKPLKMRLTCTRAGHEPWIIPYDIERPPTPFLGRA